MEIKIGELPGNVVASSSGYPSQLFKATYREVEVFNVEIWKTRLDFKHCTNNVSRGLGMRSACCLDSAVHLYLNMLWMCAVDTNSSHLGRLGYTADCFWEQISMTSMEVILHTATVIYCNTWIESKKHYKTRNWLTLHEKVTQALASGKSLSRVTNASASA